MSAKKVFISYSHDSDEHRERVLGLSERLRNDGLETLLDQYVNGSPSQGWPRWMLDQFDAADSVLVVCTETYYRRFRGHEVPGKGKGADWEGALITQGIYDARSATLKFVPVLFAADDEKFIPEPLRSGTYYTLTSAGSYQSLYDFLLEQAGIEPGLVGTPKPRARTKGKPLTFAEEPKTYSVKADISRIIKYAPAELIGRESETKLLNDAWDQAVRAETKRRHVLTFVALGGEGKTSLIAKWAADLAFQDWPGCDAVFAWSFYSQGTREQTAVSSDSFLAEALTFFGDAAMAGSAVGAFDKGRRLAQLVGERRALLILDGLEPLQYAPTSPTPGELKDQGIAALLKGLAATNSGLCIVTTRYAIPDLRAYWQTTAPMLELLRLATGAGVKLLRTIGVKTGSKEDFEKLVEDVDGHALTLQIIGQFLVRAFHGDIRRRDRIDLQKADARIQGGHAFRAMASYVKWLEDDSEESRRELAVLKLLGLFDRPATADCVEALRQAPAIPRLTEPLVGLADEDWEFSLTALKDTKLLTVNRQKGSGNLVSLDAHPLLREYFAKRLRQQQPEAWRAAHRRLYEHLCATTHEGDQPTLEDLQPLYQAVAHGCHAGLEQEACAEVYHARILRGDENYSVDKLGAFGSDLGACACFFESPWRSVSSALTEAFQAWMLNQTAAWLRARGRLTEALEPMRIGLDMRIKQEVWNSAAVVASNLSELELTLGNVDRAVVDAEASVTYADRSGESFWRMLTLCKLADPLCQSGQIGEARIRFHEAEAMLAKLRPETPLLHSLQGYQYCELLMTDIERRAWHLVYGSGLPPSEVTSDIEELGSVKQRAEQALKWGEIRGVLLDIGLGYLTLGRVALYAAILEGVIAPALSCDEEQLLVASVALDTAVVVLRRSGNVDDLPRGLLIRAWLRFLEGKYGGAESAQSDLDEAWEIAERGPMRLFMADIHLYRARLFGGMKDEGSAMNYPWDKNPDGTPRGPKDDLAAARKLIEQCGYWRRKEELEDAEEAAKNWQTV